MARPRARIAAIIAVIAVPIEWVNYRYLAFPIDVGYENPTWFQNVTGTEWLMLHFPGLMLLPPLERHGFHRLLAPTLVISGYLDTFLIAFLAVLLFRWVARRMKTRTPAV